MKFLRLLPFLAALLPGALFATHIVLVGDSTVAEKGGWGGGLIQGIDSAVKVSNTSRTGRSSKTFIAEGLWAKALALKGDYYLIQFGHNDELADKPDRATTVAEYRANFARFIDDVRAAGGQPILVTPMVRRQFKDKKNPNAITTTLTVRSDAIKQLAKEKNVPVIDLHEVSKAICEKLGPKGCEQLNAAREDGKVDTMHLSPQGQVVFGRVVALSLRKIAPDLASAINPDRIGAPAKP